MTLLTAVMDDIPIQTQPYLPLDRGQRIAKRITDLVVAIFLLVLTTPLMLLVAIAIRCDSPGAVFYKQERVGYRGRRFQVLKFRSMVTNAEKEGIAIWATEQDPRTTRLGRLIRLMRIDELPQLINVIRGEMSIVGPRPERPYFVAKFSQTYPGYAARHRMQTGITGLAQVHGLRGDTSIEDRCRFDNAYIDNWSMWQDICILLRTAAALVRPTGS